MKIVDVNEFYAERGGGVKTYVNAKLQAARDAGHELVVIAPGPEDGVEERFGGRVHWVGGPPMPFDPRYFVLYRERAVHALIDAEEPDVLEGSSTWTAGWFAARYPRPVVKALIYHQDPIAVYPHTLLDRWFSPGAIDLACAPYWSSLRALARRFQATLVAGRWLEERLRGAGVANAQTVPFGIERERFSPTLANAAIRERWLRQCGLPPSARLLVTISRLHPEKRVRVLLRALEQLNAKRPTGLVIIGDGPLRKSIARAVQGTRGAHLAGFVEDRELIAQTLASADAFVHGSAAETFGFVIAEALSSGCPVVAPARGGAAELVTAESGMLYRPGDAADCARAVEVVTSRDRIESRRQARRAAEEHLISKQEHFRRLFAFYESLSAQV